MVGFNFNKEHTQIAKGVAILLMFMHHLFAFPDRIFVEQGYISLLTLKGYNIEYLIGVFGKICVAMYLFLSGYGIYVIIQKEGTFTMGQALKRIKNMYLNYWIVFILFIPIGFIFFNKNFNINEFILNFLGLSSSYNGEWWFFRLYIELLLIVPLLRSIINNKSIKSLINIIALVFFAKILNKIINIIPNSNVLTDTLLYKDLISLLQWQAAFCMGYLCAKFNIYRLTMKYLKNRKLDNIFIYCILAILVVVIRFLKGGGILTDSILAPIFIFATVNIVATFKIQKIFISLGKHSTNMWLTHSFFCYTYFQWLVFKPRVSFLILVFLVILSMGTSVLINKIFEYYKKLLQHTRTTNINIQEAKKSHLQS